MTTGRELVMARVDGERVDVYNHANVSTKHFVNAVGGHETFDPEVTTDNGEQPDAVTRRLADYLWFEFDIDVEDLGIEVVDLEDDGVVVL